MTDSTTPVPAPRRRSKARIVLLVLLVLVLAAGGAFGVYPWVRISSEAGELRRMETQVIEEIEGLAYQGRGHRGHVACDPQVDTEFLRRYRERYLRMVAMRGRIERRARDFIAGTENHPLFTIANEAWMGRVRHYRGGYYSALRSRSARPDFVTMGTSLKDKVERWVSKVARTYQRCLVQKLPRPEPAAGAREEKGWLGKKLDKIKKLTPRVARNIDEAWTKVRREWRSGAIQIGAREFKAGIGALLTGDMNYFWQNPEAKLENMLGLFESVERMENAAMSVFDLGPRMRRNIAPMVEAYLLTSDWNEPCASYAPCKKPFACVDFSCGADVKKVPASRSERVSAAERESEADAQCENGDASACNTMGTRYLSGKGVQRSSEKALHYFEKGCGLGNGMSCGNIGTMYDQAMGVPEDPAKGLRYYERGCRLGNGTCCSMAGTILYFGQGVPRDIRAAAPYFRKACDLDNAKGCENIGALYANGEAGFRDLGRAAELYQKACDLGSQKGCRRARAKRKQLGTRPEAAPKADLPRDVYRVHQVESWDVLNMRARPHHRAPIVEKLAHDARCIRRLEGRKRVGRYWWWHIQAPSGRRGWVNAKYLRPGGPGCR